MKILRPRRIDWPAAFWERATSSYADNDLVCRDCQGRGCQLSREDIEENTGPEDVACPTCRGSGLLAPAREVPDDVEGMIVAEEAGDSWLNCIGHKGDGLLWPALWCWRISGRRFGILHDVYLGGPDIPASMHCGSVVVGLFKLDEGSTCQLEEVFHLACGEEAEVPAFVMPRRSG